MNVNVCNSCIMDVNMCNACIMHVNVCNACIMDVNVCNACAAGVVGPRRGRRGAGLPGPGGDQPGARVAGLV